MKLWEINKEIEELTSMFEYNAEAGAFVNQETGEIMSEEELDGLFDNLQMEKHDILVYLAKEALNLGAEIDAVKAEEKRLKEYRMSKERKADRLLRIIDRECAGVTTDLEVAKFKYRKSEGTTWAQENESKIILWLETNGHKECIKYAAPEIRKMDLKKLIKSGTDVPDVTIEQRLNGSLG